MRAEADASPVRGLFRVRKRIAVLHQRRRKLMYEMRVRTTVSCPLGETQVRFLRQIIDPPRSESADWRRQQLRVIGNFDLLWNFRLRQLRCVKDVRFVFDQGPFE